MKTPAEPIKPARTLGAAPPSGFWRYLMRMRARPKLRAQQWQRLRPRRLGAGLQSIITSANTESVESAMALTSLSYGVYILYYSDALNYPAWHGLAYNAWARPCFGGVLIIVTLLELYGIDQNLAGIRRATPWLILSLWAWTALTMYSPVYHDPPIVSAVWRVLCAYWVILRRRKL